MSWTLVFHYTHSDFLLELSEFSSSKICSSSQKLSSSNNTLDPSKNSMSSKNSRVPKVVKFQKLLSVPDLGARVPETLEFQKLSSSILSELDVAKLLLECANELSGAIMSLNFSSTTLLSSIESSFTPSVTRGSKITSEFQTNWVPSCQNRSVSQFNFWSIVVHSSFHAWRTRLFQNQHSSNYFDTLSTCWESTTILSMPNGIRLPSSVISG